MSGTDAARQVIVGLFYATPQAEIALTELKAAGYLEAELSEVGVDQNERPVSESGSAAAAPGATFFREHETRSSAFASELCTLDFSTSDAEQLVTAIVRGKTIVTVDTAPLGPGAAEGIFERHSATIFRSTSVAQSFPPLESPAEELAPESEVETLPDAARDVAQERVLELREEQLIVAKEPVAYGEATVSKRVVTEMQTIEVPVTREELVIERVPVAGDPAASSIDAGERGEQIVIPLTREVVSVDKRVVPIEEVTVGVRRVEGVAHVEEALRSEELVVEHEPEPEH